MWSWALRNLVIPGADLYFGQRLMNRLRFLEKAQWWNRSRLEAYRSDCLATLIRTAYTEVSFYRELMQSAGIMPNDIRTPEDLHRLPIVTKSMLREAYPHRAVRKTGQETYETGSSGSTGVNTVVREDPETAGVYRASLLLWLEWAGWRFGEAHVQIGANRERSRDRSLKDFFLRCNYVSALDLSEQNFDRVLELLERKRIQHVWGFPRTIYFLARRARQRGWNAPLRSIVTWGDNLFIPYRNTIEAAFRTRVFDTYGCAEGFQIAAQCGIEQNYHIQALDVIVELLDDEGQPVAPGQPGNVVITRLHPGPMPLVRYQVGDVAVRGPMQACPCGRAWERLGGIYGRDTDVVFTPSGDRLTAHFFAGVLELCPEVATLQIVQEELSSIVVRVVPAREHLQPPDWRGRVVAALKERGAQELRIDVEVVQDVPRNSSGKRLFVINKLLSGTTIGSRPPRPFGESVI